MKQVVQEVADTVQEVVDTVSKSKKNLQKQYHTVVSGMFFELVKKMKSSGLQNLVKKKEISFVNMLYPDFTYKYVGPYKITPHSSDKYMGYFSACLCKLSYEETPKIEKTLRSYILDGSGDELEVFREITSSHERYKDVIKMFLVKFKNSKAVFVIFRGAPFFSDENWEIDFDFDTVSPYENKDCKVHKGFYTTLFLRGEDDLSLYEKIIVELESLEKEYGGCMYIAAGHSMAGALASIFSISLKLLNSGTLRISKIFTFGSPKIGNKKFVAVNKEITRRYILDLDVVPILPEWLEGHGKETIITKLLPVFAIRSSRAALPLIAHSLTDNYPGEYFKHYGRKFGLVYGSSGWKKYLKKFGDRELETKDLSKRVVKLERTVGFFERKLAKEREEKKKMEKQIKVLTKMVNLLMKKNKIKKNMIVFSESDDDDEEEEEEEEEEDYEEEKKKIMEEEEEEEIDEKKGKKK